MRSHNLILWNERLTFGQPTFRVYQGTSIIDYFLSNTELDCPDLHIEDELSLKSSHSLLTLSFTLSNSYSDPHSLNAIARPQWRLSKLKNPHTRRQYKEDFTHSLSIEDIDVHHIPSFSDTELATNHIEEFSTTLCQSIFNTLNQVCGKKDLQADRHLKQFWTPEMNSTFKLKQHYYRKWRRANGLNCLKYWLKHQETGATLQRLIQQRRRETWRTFCDQMAKGEYTKAISKISRIRKRRTVNPSFSPAPSISPQSPADVMADHLQSIYSGHLLPSAPIPSSSSSSRDNQLPFSLDLCPFSVDQITDNLKQLPRKKAPGVDHVQMEMLLPLAPVLAPQLLYLFRLCWQWAYTPLTWRVAQVVPIHKKGSKTDPGNFRPISLTSIFRKLFEKCVYPSLLSLAGYCSRRFREARSALDQVHCLIEIYSILKREHNCVPTLAFLDIKSAYDTVDRS